MDYRDVEYCLTATPTGPAPRSRNNPFNPLQTLLTWGIAGAIAIAPYVKPLIKWVETPREAIAQTEGNTPSRRLTINLTITDPSDLKISEGQSITKGQVISDRVRQRERLERQKALVLNATSIVGKTEILPPPEPLPVPATRPLPPMSLAAEEAGIASAELTLTQARRAYNLALQSDPFLQPTAAVETARHEWEAAQRRTTQTREILTSISAIPGIAPAEIEHRRFQLEDAIRTENQQEAIYNQRQGELRQAQQDRVESLERLQDAIAKGEGALTVAQGLYIAAKDRQAQAQYDHALQEVQRVERANQAKQDRAAQEASYQNRLLSKEQQLFEYQTRLNQIENELSQLAQVRSPYNGTIQRIRTESQTDNSISVTVTLLPTTEGSDRPTTTPNPNPFSGL